MWNRYRNNKYGNQKTQVGQRTYHSRLEANDALWLQSLQSRGVITDLREQVRYPFVINGHTLRQYALVDFQCKVGGTTVWIETKGLPTQYWLLKKAIIEATLPEGHVYLVNPGDKEINALAD